MPRAAEEFVRATLNDYLEQKVPFQNSQRLLDLGIDSLDLIEVAFVLEEKLTGEISDSELGTWDTVQDIVDYVTEHLA